MRVKIRLKLLHFSVSRGEGVVGLSRAFVASGAGGIVASLWKVDDAATRRLMEGFYTNLWEKKMGKAEALWEAAGYVAQTGRTRHVKNLG